MRTSLLLTGTLALLVSATPRLFDRAYQDECKNALLHCTQAKKDCSSLLRGTITPSERTATTTITQKVTKSTSVTATVATVTNTITETKFVSTLFTTVEIHVTSTLSSNPQRKRDDPVVLRDLSPKVTKLPEYALKHCKNTKEYATACSAIGAKPTTTTLPARTIMSTKTVSATITTTATLSATKTVTVTTTKGTTATVPVFANACESGWVTVEGQGNVYVQRAEMGPNDYTYDLDPNYEELFALSDNGRTSGYLTGNSADGSGVLAYTHTSSMAQMYDADVDIVDFTSDYANETLHTLTCQSNTIQTEEKEHMPFDEYICTSTVRAAGVRNKFFLCQWPSGVNLPPLAIGPADHSSQFCAPVTVKSPFCGAK